MPIRLRNAIADQIREIRGDSVLMAYGVMLAFGHLLTGLYFFDGRIIDTLSNPRSTICWSFWPDCAAQRFYDPAVWKAFFLLYLVAAAIALVGFLRRRIAIGWWALLLATFLKILFMTQDYRLMGNHHMVHLFACIPFLMFAGKVQTLGLLLPMLYILAGTLRLRGEWMTGTVLGNARIPLPGELIRLGAIYVVFLELIIVWWLFSRSAFLRWTTLVQLVLFHLISAAWVGFYFPSVMITLLAFFPLLWSDGRFVDWSWKSLSRGSLIFLTLLVVAQIWSLWPDRDGALFTHRRVASLSMFDARTECLSTAWIQEGSNRIMLPLYSEKVGARLHCDPVFHEGLVRRLCLERRELEPSSRIDFVLQARRSSDGAFTKVVEAFDVCPQFAKRGFWKSFLGTWP